MFSRRFFAGSLILALFVLSSCGGGDEADTHMSSEGHWPEAFLPADVGLMFSYSLREEGQYGAVKSIEASLGKDGHLTDQIFGQMELSFEEAGVDFETGLAPAFGDQFRLVYGATPVDEESVTAYTVSTLEEPEVLTEALEVLVEAGELTEKRLSRVDAYVDEESSFYAAIYEDVLVVSNDPEALVSMLDLDEDESLWGSEVYQEALEKVGAEYLFYGLMLPSYLEHSVDLPAGFSVADIPSVVEYQMLVVQAQEEGFAFDAYMQANEDEAKAAGISFDAVPKSSPYLYEEVPNARLMGYLESYGLEQTFTQAESLGDDTAGLEGLEEFFQSYFAMDFQDEVLSFFDRAYVVALHETDGIVPGVSVYVDVSSDVDSATSLMDKLDSQLDGVMLVLETALPGAVSKGTTEVGGEEFALLEVDLSVVPREEHGPLPEVVTASPIRLMYGVMDDRLLITTADVWELDSESIADGDLYAALASHLDGVDEGLIVLDADGMVGFMRTLRALREQLSLGVSDEALDFEDLLDGFAGGIAASKTGKYESHYNGFLMLAE